MNELRYIGTKIDLLNPKVGDGFLADKDELNNFEQKIKDKFGDHSTVGMDSTKQKIYNVCYDCNIPIWNEIFQRVTNIANNCGVTLNWDEPKHCMRFTFILPLRW